MNKQPRTYIFIGGPGSGKGTQSDLLQNVLGCKKIDVGSMLRQRAHQKDSVAEEIHSYMKTGQMIPDTLLQPILEPLVTTLPGQSLILDGYCRTLLQVQHVTDWVKRAVIPEPLIINLIIDEQKTLERIEQRRYCERCKEVRYANGQEKCSVCAGPLTKREDDNPEVFKKRLVTYQEQSLPAQKELEARFDLIKVNGDDSIERVHQVLLNELRGYGFN